MKRLLRYFIEEIECSVTTKRVSSGVPVEEARDISRPRRDHGPDTRRESFRNKEGCGKGEIKEKVHSHGDPIDTKNRRVMVPRHF